MATVTEQTGRFTAQDGTTLSYRRWTPPAARLRVVVAHGLGEHGGRYGHVADALVPLGCAVWIHDHRGHGRSEGRRGHVDAFDTYVDDLLTLITLVDGVEKPRLPLVLLGHSMGGLIALRCAGRHPGRFDGLILSSPLLGLPEPPPRLLRRLVTLLSAVWPTFALRNRLDTAMISHDLQTVEAYHQDATVHDRITARWFTGCMQTLAAVHAAPDRIRGPLLLQVAGADRLVDASAALTFFDRLTTADKTLCRYDPLYHEIYNERLPDRERVLSDLTRWVEDRFLQP